MSDHDRGAYTPPTEEPLAFDARMHRARRPLPMTLIASAVVLVVLVGAVVLFYRSGVRGANEPPRVVGDTVAELKTPPVEEAKPIDEAAGLEVYVDDGQGAQAAPTFAPPPEQPQPRPQPTAPVEVATAPPVTTITPPAAAPRPAQPMTAPAPAKAAPAPVAKAAPAPTQVAEAPRPAAAAPVASGGSASVQIGAFSSQAIADSEFNKIKAAFAGQTAGKGKRVEPVERNGQTLYRTLVTGFSKADAQAFCNALKASGRSCLVK